MRTYEQKSIMGEVTDVDEKARKVKAVWSKMGVLDLDNDIIVPGAFKKTIAERGPAGSNQVWSLIDHKASMQSVIGKPTELYEQGDQLIAVTPLLDTSLGNDVLKMYEAGIIGEHSVGYVPIKASKQPMDPKVRNLNELMLLEGSAILWGANNQTPMLGLTKSMTKEEQKESLCQRLERFCKSLKHGTFTDETFSLIEIEIKQIQKAITELDTPPAVEAVEPLEEKAFLDALNSLNSKL